MKKVWMWMCLMLGIILGYGSHAMAAEDVEIAPGVNNIYIPAGQTVYCKLDCSKYTNLSNRINVFTTGSKDTYGYLCDRSKNELTRDDDGGSDHNFKISYPINTKGIYYVGVRFYNEKNSGTVSLVVEKHQHDWSSNGLYQNDYVTPNKSNSFYKVCSASDCDEKKFINAALKLLKNGKTKVSKITAKKCTKSSAVNKYTFSADTAELLAIPVSMPGEGKLHIDLSAGNNIKYIAICKAKPSISIYNDSDSDCYQYKVYDKSYDYCYKQDNNYKTFKNASLVANLKKGNYYLIVKGKSLSKMSGNLTCFYYDKLPFGKWINCNGEDQWYKVVVKERGYLKFEKSKGVCLEFYAKDKKKEYTYLYNDKIKCYPVEAGTYYLKSSENEQGDKFKCSFYKAPKQKNYSWKSAISLAKDKKAAAVIYSKDSKKKWSRYYKIKLTKIQRVCITSTNAQVDIYKPNKDYSGGLQWIDTSSEQDEKTGKYKIYSDDKLSAGTYYIGVSETYSYVGKKNNIGYATEFSWK